MLWLHIWYNLIEECVQDWIFPQIWRWIIHTIEFVAAFVKIFNLEKHRWRTFWLNMGAKFLWQNFGHWSAKRQFPAYLWINCRRNWCNICSYVWPCIIFAWLFYRLTFNPICQLVYLCIVLTLLELYIIVSKRSTTMYFQALGGLETVFF